MKFAATLLSAAFLSSDVLAGNRAMFAQCMINVDNPASNDFKGSIFVKQRISEDPSIDYQSKYVAVADNLIEGKTYSLALLDDDVPDCGSQLEPLFDFDGREFSVPEDSDCRMIRETGKADIDLSGDFNYIGKYIQVNNDDGQVGCCRIERLQRGDRPRGLDYCGDDAIVPLDGARRLSTLLNDYN